MWGGPSFRVRRRVDICFVPDTGESLEDARNVDMWVIFADGLRSSRPRGFAAVQADRLARRVASRPLSSTP